VDRSKEQLLLQRAHDEFLVFTVFTGVGLEEEKFFELVKFLLT